MKSMQDPATLGRSIRAVFLDVDGTLVTIGTHRMPPALPAALQALRQKGIAVLLSTGRHALEIAEENLLPGLVFDGAVYMNGQLCEWQGKTVLENPIPRPALQGLRRYLQQNEIACVFLEKDRMYANCVTDRMRREQALIGTRLPPLRPLDDLEQRRVYQIIPFVTPAEEAALVAAMPGCKALRWSDYAVDVTSTTGGKENGIRAVCAAMGLAPQQIMAFGDAANDIGMLQLSGLSVAMGNALPEVQKCADYVTDTVEENGILHALQHFGLLD